MEISSIPLWPAASNVIYKPKADQRVIVNYTLLSDQQGKYDHYAKVNGIQEILTKEIVNLTTENEKEIGNDPVKILDLWTGDGYLNIHFGYNVGGLNNHYINLVKNKLEQSGAKNATEPIILEFRHNANEDSEIYGIKSYAAFNLRALQVEGQDSVKLIIKVKDFQDQEKEFPITYKYKKAVQPAQTLKNITTMPDNSYSIR